MNYELIKKRAEAIFDQIEDKINYGYDMDSPYLLDAYKATFGLKVKSISQYVRAFSDTGLVFSISSVEIVYEEYADYLEGFKGLSPAEKDILRELLDLVKRKNDNSLSLCH